MTAPDDHAHGAPLRYHHDSPEFHRVVALSDGLVVAALTGTAVGVVMGVVAPSAYRGWKRRPGL